MMLEARAGLGFVQHLTGCRECGVEAECASLLPSCRERSVAGGIPYE